MCKILLRQDYCSHRPRLKKIRNDHISPRSHNSNSHHNSNNKHNQISLNNITMSIKTNATSSYPIMADESIMKPKAHGTSEVPVQENLRWGCDTKLADRICNFNRHYAEHSSYFQSTDFIDEAEAAFQEGKSEITFYDSNTGKPLFVAPRGRTWEQFLNESKNHGWPSFRDEEVVWENMRCVPGGESVSTDGTHLGHNLPDEKGNRYCINLVSVAGRPTEEEK